MRYVRRPVEVEAVEQNAMDYLSAAPVHTIDGKRQSDVRAGYAVTLANGRSEWVEKSLFEGQFIAVDEINRNTVDDLIDAGVRALARKLHPDLNGGDHDSMVAVNRAAEFIRAKVNGDGR